MTVALVFSFELISNLSCNLQFALSNSYEIFTVLLTFEFMSRTYEFSVFIFSNFFDTPYLKFVLNSPFLKFILEVLSYSLGIYIILTYLGYFEFSTVNLVKCLFPLSFKVYWFATVYLIIYILSPFINRLIKSLSKKEFCLLNIILFIICSIIPTLTTQ